MIVVKHRKSPDVVLLQVDCANLEAQDLAENYLRGAAMGGLRCRGANFRRADLRNADLRDADLRSAQLVGVRAQGADLRSADLRGAVLAQADLTGADLRRADLRGADLQQASLEGANLRGARSDQNTRWPETDTWKLTAPGGTLGFHWFLLRPAAPAAAWRIGLPSALAAAAVVGMLALVGLSEATLHRELRKSGPTVRPTIVSRPLDPAREVLERADTPEPPTGNAVPRPVAPAVRPVIRTVTVPRRRDVRSKQANVSRVASQRPVRTVRRQSKPRREVVVQRPESVPGAAAATSASQARSLVSTQTALTTPSRSRFEASLRTQGVVLASYTPRQGVPTGGAARRPSRPAATSQVEPATELRASAAPPAEEPAKIAPVKSCPPAKVAPAAPRAPVAWGNSEFHYGSGYDIYTMHQRSEQP